MNYCFDGSKEQIVVKMGKAHAIALCAAIIFKEKKETKKKSDCGQI